MCYETGWRRKKPKLADQKRARGGSLRSHLECHEAPLSPETPHFPVRTRRYPEKRKKLNMKDQEATVSMRPGFRDHPRNHSHPSHKARHYSRKVPRRLHVHGALTPVFPEKYLSPAALWQGMPEPGLPLCRWRKRQRARGRSRNAYPPLLAAFTIKLHRIHLFEPAPLIVLHGTLGKKENDFSP